MADMLQAIWFSNKTAKISTTFQQLQIIVKGNLGNYEAWRKMVYLNPELFCTHPGGVLCDSAAAEQNIRVVTALYDPSTNPEVVVEEGSTTGFTVDGQPCNTFDGVNGSNTCPIHIDVFWKANCLAAATCDKPINLVRVKFTYKPENPEKLPSVNVANYDMDWTDRRALSSDGAVVECGMDPWGMVYVSEPNKTFNTASGTWTSDLRGCLPAMAFEYP